MAVKGYTREEMAEMQHKKRIRAFHIVLAVLFILTAVNIAGAVVKLGVVGFITLLIFLFLYVLLVRGIDMLDEEGHNTKTFRRLRTVVLILYSISFVMAVLRI